MTDCFVVGYNLYLYVFRYVMNNDFIYCEIMYLSILMNGDAFLIGAYGHITSCAVRNSSPPFRTESSCARG